MIKFIILVVVLAVLSIYFGVLIGFNNVIFWIIGGLVIGAVGALISYLLKNRGNLNIQQNKQDAISKAEEIKKYKDLLDSGAITQEEFEQKKRDILGR